MNAKRFPLRFWVNWSITALVLTCSSKTAFAADSMQYYISEVDGSRQPYRLYLPEPFDPDVAHPVAFFAHGYGGTASARFIDADRSFANANGWIMVHLDGRGNTRYDGVGEKDFFEVLDALRRTKFNIDENRLYWHGLSMGATGAFRMGFRYPDIFAAVVGVDGWCDYDLWHRVLYAKASQPDRIEPCREPLLQSLSPLHIAENGKHLNPYMVVHTSDSINSPQNGQRLHARLNELGYSDWYYEYPGGHVATYDVLAFYQFFAEHVNEPNPKHVVLKANQLKYGSIYWVRIDRLEKKLSTDVFATIEAEVSGEQSDRVEVRTSNLLQYTLFLTPALVRKDEVSVYTNGELSYTGLVEEITIFASLDESGNIVGWSTEDTLPGGLRKTAQIEGPIGHAYTSKFVLVVGTSGDESETDQNNAEAEKFKSEWNTWMHADISPVTDTSITGDDIASSNLILFGTADSNSLIQEITDFLPIRVWRDRIQVGATVYRDENYGLYMIFPNPLNLERYVVVSHGTIQGSQERDLECLPWYWPDYVVFDQNVLPEQAVPAGYPWPIQLFHLPDAWVEAGFFDQYWGLEVPDRIVCRDGRNGNPQGPAHGPRRRNQLLVEADRGGTSGDFGTFCE